MSSLLSCCSDATTSCDLIFIDSAEELYTIRNYFRLFRRLASSRRNVVVLNAHPRNVLRSKRGAENVWEELRTGRVIQEHFRCHFKYRDVSTNQMGLLVGSFIA